jgi:hypothetical protein
MASTANLMAAGIPGAAANMLDTGPIVSVTPAGASQGTAAVLPGGGNILATAAAAGVVLPPSVGQGITTVFNNSGNAQNVYPAVGETINALTANTAISLASAKAMVFLPGDKGWLAVLSA